MDINKYLCKKFFFMVQELQLRLSPQEASSIDLIKKIISKQIQISIEDITHIQVIKKSIDARSKNPIIILKLLVYISEEYTYRYENIYEYRDVSKSKEIIIVGAGPAGLFAALRLIELGLKPIILERGKDVSERKKDIALLCRNISLNEESNYCFGEGGAGTFSDGKLYTRSNKRGNIKRILEIFHLHGAQDEILYEAHPHIGTDVLPIVIKNMRQRILDCGGEIHYNSKVTQFKIEFNKIQGVRCENGDSYKSNFVILASGHSARDIYYSLYHSDIAIQAKGFAMGVRVEHPQALINQIQYHSSANNKYLPSASYSVVQQVNNRGVYSFCMCPGGCIVPSATQKSQIVVNGMSASRRNSAYANSGIVVELHPEDLPEYNKYGELAGLKFQEDFENMSYNAVESGQQAPAQKLSDFVHNISSSTLPKCSYLPGVIASPLHKWMPTIISKSLQEGFKGFNKKMPGFITNDALIVGVESRSSSPIRIPRNPITFEHINIEGLFPAGEGSGYAGGITSSAMDGENCANSIYNILNNNIL